MIFQVEVQWYFRWWCDDNTSKILPFPFRYFSNIFRYFFCLGQKAQGRNLLHPHYNNKLFIKCWSIVFQLKLLFCFRFLCCFESRSEFVLCTYIDVIFQLQDKLYKKVWYSVLFNVIIIIAGVLLIQQSPIKNWS